MDSILITAIGKRVQLIKHLKQNFRIVGIDASILNPAKNFTDIFYQVPKYTQENYVEELMKICLKENVKMIIPLFEKEFLTLLKFKDEFENKGIKLLLSDKKVIEICNGKFYTYEFFKNWGIKTPKSYIIEELAGLQEFPLIIKPEDGMGSEGVYKVHNEKELLFFYKCVNNPIIQEFIQGTEYTVDVLCDFNGKVISVVPRERLEIRAGEVSKSRTVKNENIIKKTVELIEKLNKEGVVIGPITVQCIVNETGIYFIEINPRFGGGVPLSFEAGVDYGKYLSQMLERKEVKSIIGEFKEITMLRYDEAVFI